MSIHDGHRSRMKNRFINYGLSNFDDHNVLELLLFYALPRRDINPIAHELLTRFGSLDAVFEAPIEDIMEVPYMGENAAVLLKLIPQVCRRYMTTRCIGEGILDSSAKVGEYITPSFMYEKDEVVFMLCLDAKRKLLCCCELSRGVVNTVEVSVRKIVEIALKKNAAAVILAHNHTSGIALPSREDEITTMQVKKALAMVGIELLDHIVVADGDYVSMMDSGMLKNIY